MTVAVLVMELCVVTLLAGWLWVVLAASAWPLPWAILLAAPLGLVSGRLIPFPWRRLAWFDAAWWGSVSVVVAVLAEAGNQIAPGDTSGARWNLLFFTGLVLAWRGWALAEGWIDRELVEAELQAGLLAVLGVLLVLTWVSPGAGLLPAVGFVAAGLVGLGLARRAERRAPRATLESDWLVLVGAMVVLVVAVAGLVVMLVTPDLLVVMADQARAAATAAIGGLGALLQWLASLLPSVSPPPEEVRSGQGAGPFPTSAPSTPGTVPTPPFWVFELLYTFAGVIMIIIIGRLLYRLLQSRMVPFQIDFGRRREPGPAVSEAPGFSWAGWWRSVLAWLRSWLGGRAARGPGRVGRHARDERRASPEDRSVRALYRDFLGAAQRAGFERAPSTTPFELAEALRRARPGLTGTIGLLTELYVRARYGQERLGRDELGRMRTAVQQARRALTAQPPEPTADGTDARPIRLR